MCGRFTYKMSWTEIHDLLEEFSVAIDTIGEGVVEHPPRYNISPTQPSSFFSRILTAVSGARRG